MNLRRFVGDKNFYRSILAIAIPIMIQNGITNFVNLLDNIMVGQLGTEAMSSVSIANNIFFVFILLIFGAVASAGLFSAQYHGSNDHEGLRATFRFKLILVLLTCVIGITVFALSQDALISAFLYDSDSDGDISLTLEYARDYFKIMLIGLVPQALSQVYASTLRETEKTVQPMIASFAAVFTNMVLNYVLIFGHFGAPALGVRGAAIATVISRFIEIAFLIIWTHANVKKCPFIKGAYRSIKIPKKLALNIIKRGIPLMFNEFMWAFGMTMLTQSYSTRGLDVVAALNISTTINGVFNVVYLSLGSSIAIVVGNLLGASKIEEARDTNRKMVAFSVFCSTCVSIILIACSTVIPMLYNATEQVSSLASFMMITIAIIMPFGAFAHASYFTLRSGGKVMITLMLDSGYMWILVIPVAFVLSRFTSLSIFWLYPICQSFDILKAIFGGILLKKVDWAKQII